jgi:hypothetical protein
MPPGYPRTHQKKVQYAYPGPRTTFWDVFVMFTCHFLFTQPLDINEPCIAARLSFIAMVCNGSRPNGLEIIARK